MRAYLEHELFAPIGMTSAIPRFDAAGTFIGSSFVYATARDFARFGEMYRNDGVVDGRRVLPQGWRGPAFMVFDNFDVVMQWNQSVNYALSVAHMADRLAGGAELAGGQEAEHEALSLVQMMSLQRALDELGFAPGAADGLPGMRTQTAIRRYQRAHCLPADGHASPTLLAHVQQAHAEAAAAGRLTSSQAQPTFAGPQN